MEIGFVISGANTKQFQFVIKNKAKVGDYVKVGTVLGQISEIEIVNEHLSDQLAFVLGDELLNHYPIKDNLVRIATVEILGNYDPTKEEKYVPLTYPPEPGSKVFMAPLEEVKDLLNILEKEHSIDVGTLRGYKEKIFLDVEKLIGKHLSVLAMSGAGKSNFVSVVIDELMKKGNEFPIVLLDIHGEYLGFEKKYGKRTMVYPHHRIKLSFEEFEPGIVRDLVGTTEPIEYLLTSLIQSNNFQSLDELITYVEGIKKKSKEVKALEWRLKRIKQLGLFQDTPFPSLEDIKIGSLTLFDFSEVSDNRKLSIYSYILLKRLFEARRLNKIPPLIVVLEEAHNLAPEHAEAKLSRRIIEKIAREGRKFGMFLIVVSQRPAYLSQTLLAQMNVQTILRITNPHDLQYISQTSEHISSNALKQIPSLVPGEALLIGYARFPIYIKTKRRDPKIEEVRNKRPYQMLSEFLEQDSLY